MNSDQELRDLGVVSFHETSEPVDVLSSSPEELRSLGINFPADLLSDPGRERLRLLFPQGLSLIRPELHESATKRHGPLQRADAESTTTPTWSGAVIAPSVGKSFTGISAQWNVPAVTAPFGQTGEFDSSSWIGIDGDGTPQVFQAGAEQQASDGGTSYYCWYEWFPNLEVSISNLPVGPGSAVFASLVATSPSLGHVFLVSGSKAVSMDVSAPAGFAIEGGSAEWIMERPSDAKLIPYRLPVFSDLTFILMSASDSNHNAPPGQSAPLLSMVVDGLEVARPAMNGADSMIVTYPGPPGVSTPSGYLGDTPRVVYPTWNGHIRELSIDRETAAWQESDISAVAGAPPAAAGTFGRPCGYLGDGLRVVYRAVDGHIHEFTIDQHTGAWQQFDMNAATGAPPAARGAAGTPCGSFAVVPRVVYTAADDHIHEFSINGQTGAWQQFDMNVATGAPPAGSAPCGYLGDGPRVVYRAVGGHIHELSINGQTGPGSSSI